MESDEQVPIIMECLVIMQRQSLDWIKEGGEENTFMPKSHKDDGRQKCGDDELAVK